MSLHKCDSSVCLQRPGAELAIFRTSPVYKAHSLNGSISSLPHRKLQNTSNRCSLKTAHIKEDNWKDVGKVSKVSVTTAAT